MPRSTPTYDEITRSTVIEPDLSFRPTPEQIAEGHIGERALFSEERELLQRVREALQESQLASEHVSIEVEHTKIVLRGHVRDMACMRAIEHAVEQVEGVDAVDSHLVVQP